MTSKSSRKRRKRRPPAKPAPASTRPAPPSPRRVASGGEPEPPPAPWGSFPLIELSTLLGIVMLVGGFIIGGTRGVVLIVTGLALGSIGGLELSIREHFAGFRSHTLVLAAVPAVIAVGLLFYAAPDRLPAVARAAIGLVVLAAAALLLSNAFRRRSGGARFRFGTFRDRR